MQEMVMVAQNDFEIYTVVMMTGVVVKASMMCGEDQLGGERAAVVRRARW